MTNSHSSKPINDHAYEQLVAEEELILHAQMLIQRVLNDREITQKHLAEKLGVGESYVSQMLGGSARNLTLRTIARVMKALDVKAAIVLDDYAGASLGNAPVRDSKAAAAVASRLASSRFWDVWGEVKLPPQNKRARRRPDARAYASYDPPVQEMALAA